RAIVAGAPDGLRTEPADRGLNLRLTRAGICYFGDHTTFQGGTPLTVHYTADPLTREAKLLVTELARLADFVIGHDAGLRALGLEADSDFAQSRHPDDLGEIAGMALFEHVTRVERYVRDQEWAREIASDVSALQLAVERTFSPAVLHGY